MTEIVWVNVEPTPKKEIEKFLSPFLWLVPAWCQRLFIQLHFQDEGSSAIRTGIRYEYRTAHMDFYSCWLAESDEAKQIHVIHDLLHVTNSIYIDFTDEMINRFCPKEDNEKFHGFLKEESRMLCESMTQDLAKVIHDRLK